MKKTNEQIVADFNRDYPAGTRMIYKSAPGVTGMVVTVRDDAFVLGGHTPCALVDGVRGAVAINALEPVPS